MSCLGVYGRSSQLVPDVFGLDLLDPLDVVGLLQAPVASLLPIAQDLLEVADLELFQVHALEVNLLVCKKFNQPLVTKYSSCRRCSLWFHFLPLGVTTERHPIK